MFDSALRHDLAALYPPAVVEVTVSRLLELARAHRRPRGMRPLGHDDVWLIAYADHVHQGARAPLQVMRDLLEGPFAGAVNGVHLLPFHPSTSDDGFAVVDPRRVDPALGGWDDVAAIARGNRLMVDAVVNHLSASSRHVTEWTGHALEVDEAFDTSQVTRPRTSPLVTDLRDASGGSHRVWTTFSADQVDLDYRNPDVLVDVTSLLLEYVDRGASVIRLDAVGFLWKASGTTCMHLPQTHAVVRLWRTMLDHCAPGTLLVTETNVPHEQNVSYLGNGADEAHMVYQFALAPLVLAAMVWGNAQDLTRWAASIDPPPGQTTFLNFLGSHDGIGLRPVEGLLSKTQIEGLCALAMATEGGVSHRTGPDGRAVPYELNTTITDALAAIAPDGMAVPRVLAAHAIMLALQGVPAVWLGALVGDTNWTDGVASTGQLRAVNRRRFDHDDLVRRLADPRTLTGAVFAGLRELIDLRTASPAFAPSSPQRIIAGPSWLFGVERGAGSARNVVLVSVSGRDRPVSPAGLAGGGAWRDRLAGPGSPVYGPGDLLVLPPYGVAWLELLPS